MTKIHLNNLGIILGTKCNLRCRHCMGCEPKEQITIQNNYIDDLIQNITGIDELTFAGYEPTLYIKEMRMVFDKLIQSGIKVNRFDVCTNGSIYSQELVDFVKNYQKYVTYPEKVQFHFSDDDFHFNNGFTHEIRTENINKYREALNNCRFVKKKINSDDKSQNLLIQGRAVNLNKQDIDRIAKVDIPISDNTNLPVIFKNRCEGAENTCNNGVCVHNCIVSPIVMTPNGFIFIDDAMAFNAISTGDYVQSIGNITEMQLYKMVQNQMDKFDENKEHIYYVNFKNEYNLIWQTRKVIFDYIVYVNRILDSLQQNDKSLYKTLRINLNDELYKMSDKLSVCNGNSQEIEAANNICKYLKTDCQSLISVADSYFSLSFMKSLFAIQIEMYKQNSPFSRNNFYNLVGIDYDLFMDYWNFYYDCDFDNFKNTVLKIRRRTKTWKSEGEFNEQE